MQSMETEMCINLSKVVGHKARKSGVNSLRSSGSHRERENGRTKHNSSALQRPLVSSIPEADTTPTDLFFTGTANRESGMFGMIYHVISQYYKHI